MVDVAIIGAGQTKYGNHQSGMKGMWAEAALNAFDSVDKDFEPNIIDGYTIAVREFEAKKLPFIICRPMPNGAMEYWKLRDLEIVHF